MIQAAIPAIMTIVRGAIPVITWLGRLGMVAFTVNEVRKFLGPNEQYVQESLAKAEEGGISDEEQKKIRAATVYEQIEDGGKSPDEFWGSLTQAQQQELKFSPQSLRESMRRTSFLGTAATLLWIAAGVAAGIAAFRGLPVSLQGLSKIAAIPKTAKNATMISNELQLMKTAILNKTWVPGTAAGIATAGGWLTSSMVNNLNDPLLWGRIFLDQAHQDVQKAAQQQIKGASGGGTAVATVDAPRTIIRMVQEHKPQQFIGTLFSSKLGSAASFDRVLDDKITDMDDLREDAKLNLNKWLASLPGRLGYSVVIRKDPVDETGSQQSGIWATLTLFITHISGKTTPIDTILLGPVEPQVRLELQKQSKTIETEIADMLKVAEVREFLVPTGAVDIFSATGERITPAVVAGADIASNSVENTTKETPAPAEKTSPLGAGFELIPVDRISRGNIEEIKRYTALGYGFEPVVGAQQSLLDVYKPKEKTAANVPPGAYEIKAEDDVPVGFVGTIDRINGKLYAMPSTKLPANAGAGQSIQPRTITVNIDALMVRSAPNTTAPLAGSQRLVRGNTFVAVGWQAGENVNGENRWWLSSKGNYVWSGGTAEKPT